MSQYDGFESSNSSTTLATIVPVKGSSVSSFSARSSIGSSNASRYTNSGLTATSTYSSLLDENDQTSTNSSAIGFLNDSVAEGDEFGIVDTLDYEDVDDGIIDHEYMHRSREAIIEQLLDSEKAYVESLELVMKYFLLPLRKDAKQSSFNFLGMKKMVCTEREFRWLFGNFEEVMTTHRLILQSLEERLRIWGPTQILSDVLQAWTAHKEKALKGSSLISLLQLPSGCINRYTDIITRLSESTPAMHPDYSGLQKAKSFICHYQRSVQEKLSDASNVDQVLMIHEALIGAPFSVRAERRLVIQGKLSRVVISTRSMGEERNYMLFSDLLLFVRPKVEAKVTRLQYKGHLTLERAKIRALSKEEAGGIGHCIEITSSFSGVDNLNSTFVASPTIHVLYIGSEEDRTHWLKCLKKVIDNLDKIALAKHAQASRRMVQSRTPNGNATGTTISSNDSLKTSSSRGSSQYTSN
ncbi:hypothetical protein MFLAVUS_004343 [Mucor flavus]|uniref:Dbl homology domain-containing protein n=1 Tax=Mucor flavus TaxID=439312 RepID=A0ABP9YVN1_9FUNG